MTDPSITGLEYWFSRSSRYDDVLVDNTTDSDGRIIPVLGVAQPDLPDLLGGPLLEPLHRTWASTARFKAAAGEVCLLPSQKGDLARVLLGLGPSGSAPAPWPYAALAKLPPGTYRLEDTPTASTPAPTQVGQPEAATPAAAAAVAAAAAPSAVPVPGAAASAAPADGWSDRAALGFLLGHYSFDRYKKGEGKGASGAEGAAGAAAAAAGEGGKARLVWPAGCNRLLVQALARSFVWCRDLISTPAEDLGPQHLAAEVAALAAGTPGAAFELVAGEDLLELNYPAIHTVGRASYRPPVLARLEWAPPRLPDASTLPLLALVGKGVCFDTGGLNLKPAASMKNMKKDMGGAALVLALARVVMSAGLAVRLLVLVPAVENSVAGNAYRPLDVLQTRAGITVENGNTDAEGRLILADALADAAARGPDLIIDAATLTGAARTALGADLPAVFTNDDGVWRQLEAAAAKESDLLWRLPLHAPYRKTLDSKVADLSSTGLGDGLAGAIVAALFLEAFVKGVDRWVHIDTSAYNAGPAVGLGRPEGGEAQALRALWRMLYERYGTLSAAAM